MTQITHIINSLQVGGAERMLEKLLSQETFLKHGVMTLFEGGPIADSLRQRGFDVTELNIKKRPWNVLKLFSIKQESVVAWMYHSCLLACIVKLAHPSTKLTWNIRHSIDDISKEKKLTRIVIRLLEMLAWLPDAVIFNSTAASLQHKCLIRPNKKISVIPNGFIPLVLRENTDCRKIKNIGVFARYHPMKGHEFFLKIAAKLKTDFPYVKFLFVGEGCDENNPVLNRVIKDLDIKDSILLRGKMDQMESSYAEIDLLVVPSLYGEGFSNVLGEAMLHGKPCIASNVGDSRYILNLDEWIFWPGNDLDLELKLRQMLKLPLEQLQIIGTANSKRIKDHFLIQKITTQFAHFLESL